MLLCADIYQILTLSDSLLPRPFSDRKPDERHA